MTISKNLARGLALALLVAAPVHAKVVATATRSAMGSFDGTVLLPLNDAGATSLTFSGRGRHVISYSAVCRLLGDSVDWISIQIILDGVALAPTAGTDDAFCAGRTPELTGGGRTFSVHYDVVTPMLAAGTHTVQVEFTPVDGVGPIFILGGDLGQSTLVVSK